MITAANSTIQNRVEAAIVAFLRSRFVADAPEHLDVATIGEVNGYSETTGTDEGDTTDTLTVELAAAIPPVYRGDRLTAAASTVEVRKVVSQTATSLVVEVTPGVPSGAVSISRTSRIRRSDNTASREGLPWLCVVQATNLTETWPGANNYRGTLFIGLDGASNLIEATDGDPLTQSERDANLASHNRRAAFIAAELEDVPAVGTFVNDSELCGVTDFTLAALLSATEPGGNAEMGCFTWLLTRTIVCEGMSY